MTVLHPAMVSTRQFDWVPADRRYIGEISSTNGFGRVYDDACDEGLTLVSARTGTAVPFVVNETVRDRDGDVQYWVLVPANQPRLNITITLFND